jgi:hypothetical protein
MPLHCSTSPRGSARINRCIQLSFRLLSKSDLFRLMLLREELADCEYECKKKKDEEELCDLPILSPPNYKGNVK